MPDLLNVLKLPPLPGARPRADTGFEPMDLSFPVTLNGMTKDKIVEAVQMAREDLMFARGDFAGELRRIEAAEKKLAPLALKITAAMKTRPEDRAAEIRGHAGGKGGEKLRRMGRDALNARAVLRNTARDLKLHRTLADDAQTQLDVATAAVDAQAKRDEKVRLLAKAEEIKTALGFVTSLFEKAVEFDPDKLEITDATIAGLGVKLLSWGLRALSGADKLIEKAKALEDEAAAIDVDNLKKTLQRTTKLVRELGEGLKGVANALGDDVKSFRQQSTEAEGAYDASSKKKGSTFKFAEFESGVEQSLAIIAMLDAAIRAQKTRIAGKLRAGTALANLLSHAGKCLTHHDKGPKYPDFKPDPTTVQKETLEMKAIVKAGVTEIAAQKKELEKGLLGVELMAGDAGERQQKWVAYLEPAQTALFSAPEPAAKGR